MAKGAFSTDIGRFLGENLGWMGMSWGRQIGARDYAHAYIAAMALAAFGCFAFAFSHWRSADLVKFACYLVAALLVSPFKVRLPGIEGTLSVNFLFTMIGILEMSLPETLLFGLVSTLGQFYWKPARRLRPIQLIFNLSQVTVSATTAYAAYHLVSTHVLHGPGPLALVVAAVAHFAVNTLATSTIIGLTEDQPLSKIWTDSYLWSFPYYMVGAAVAGLVGFLNRHLGWQSSLLILPPIYLIYRSYRLYLGKLQAEKEHAEQVSNLHLRTLEAQAQATTDYLTGLPNSRSLFAHLAQEVSRALLMNTPLAIMVCDINGLKKINDSFGHLEGDRLLREFSALLKQECRDYDYVARMGGDEFVVTAPGLSPEALEGRIDRLKQAAIEAGRRICGHDITSLSVGASFCPKDGYDVEALLAQADRRMYSMKQAHYARLAASRETKARGATGK